MANGEPGGLGLTLSHLAPGQMACHRWLQRSCLACLAARPLGRCGRHPAGPRSVTPGRRQMRERAGKGPPPAATSATWQRYSPRFCIDLCSIIGFAQITAGRDLSLWQQNSFVRAASTSSRAQPTAQPSTAQMLAAPTVRSSPIHATSPAHRMTPPVPAASSPLGMPPSGPSGPSPLAPPDLTSRVHLQRPKIPMGRHPQTVSP